MTTGSKDEYFMREALKLARRGAGRVSPNPMVGAVIVRNGEIVGTGYHRVFGGAHAEINALKSAGKAAKGADIYVTLEPCSHFGKTPPCTQALISGGIKRVLVGMTDPNPLVCGQGIKQLEQAGIRVSSGILETDCRQLNEAFVKYMTRKTPFVILKSALSLDGKIAAHTGDSKWITCEKSRKLVHRMRYEADAVMVGVGTVIADDPLLNVRLFRKGRKEPFRVVVDSRLDVPLSVKILKPGHAAKTIIAALKENENSRKAAAIRQTGAQVLGVPGKGGRLDLKKLVRLLAKKEMARILLEGGSEVNAAALEAGIVDKVALFYAPKIVGGKKALGMVGGAGQKRVKDAVNIDSMNIKRVGSDFLVEGYVV